MRSPAKKRQNSCAIVSRIRTAPPPPPFSLSCISECGRANLRPYASLAMSGWRSKRAKNGSAKTSFCVGLPFTPMVRKILPYIDFAKARSTNLHSIASTVKRILPNHHVHELRHTYVSRCKECGVSGRSRQPLGRPQPVRNHHFHRLYPLFHGISAKRNRRKSYMICPFDGAFSPRISLPNLSPICPFGKLFGKKEQMYNNKKYARLCVTYSQNRA